MVLKTFNVDESVYTRFSSFCKSHGISMSKQVNLFMKAQIEQEPTAKREYLEKLDKIRKGNFVQINDFPREYGL
ncbi:MAG: hypothetical protein GF334_10485 [Candidatus Altiarchaeales archaeon]|nr:hypothetical protein [Candidatus Altiarchaeales archaeon]